MGSFRWMTQILMLKTVCISVDSTAIYPSGSASSSLVNFCSSSRPSKRPQVSTRRISTGLKRIGLGGNGNRCSVTVTPKLRRTRGCHEVLLWCFRAGHVQKDAGHGAGKTCVKHQRKDQQGLIWRISVRTYKQHPSAQTNFILITYLDCTHQALPSSYARYCKIQCQIKKWTTQESGRRLGRRYPLNVACHVLSFIVYIFLYWFLVIQKTTGQAKNDYKT